MTTSLISNFKSNSSNIITTTSIGGDDRFNNEQEGSVRTNNNSHHYKPNSPIRISVPHKDEDDNNNTFNAATTPTMEAIDDEFLSSSSSPQTTSTSSPSLTPPSLLQDKFDTVATQQQLKKDRRSGTINSIRNNMNFSSPMSASIMKSKNFRKLDHQTSNGNIVVKRMPNQEEMAPESPSSSIKAKYSSNSPTNNSSSTTTNNNSVPPSPSSSTAGSANSSAAIKDEVDLQQVKQQQSCHSTVGSYLAIMPIIFGAIASWDIGPLFFVIVLVVEHFIHMGVNIILDKVTTLHAFSMINLSRISLADFVQIAMQIKYGPLSPMHIITTFKIFVVSMSFYYKSSYILFGCGQLIAFTTISLLTSFYMWYDLLSEKERADFYVKVLEVFVIQNTVLIGSFFFSKHLTEKNNQYTSHQVEIAKERVSNYEKTRFIASLSHELRNPLHAIIGSVELIKNIYKSEDCSESCKHCMVSNASFSEMINDVHENAALLLHILSSSLQMSSMEIGNIKLKVEQFNVMCLIESITCVFSPLAIEKKNTLHSFFDVSKVPMFLMGDSVRISQIVMNLVSNSIKYTKGGQVLLKCKKAKDEELKLHFQEEEIKKNCFYLKIECQDNGCGISESQIGSLFKPFHIIEKQEKTQGFEHYFKQSEFTKLNNGGSSLINTNRNGLGLNITKQIIEKMEGKIIVNSRVGEGTTMNVYIPLEEMDKQEQVTDSEGSSSSTHINLNPENLLDVLSEDQSQDLSIIIIDEDPVFRQVLSSYLNLFKRVVLIQDFETHADFVQESENILHVADHSCKYMIFCPESFCTQIQGTRFVEQLNCMIIPSIFRGETRHHQTFSYLTKPIKFVDLADLVLKEKPHNAHCKKASCTPRQSIVEVGSMPTFLGVETASPTSERSESHHPSSPIRPDISKKSIFVVDDNAVNRKILTKMLRVIGFKDIDVACDGMECFNMYKRKKYDIILLDCFMPILSGKEACEMIRKAEKQNETEKQTPILAITANTWESVDTLVGHGFDSVIYKPILLDSLKKEVFNMLRI
ncbi:predicted protein [Naegleria gruberi]|uniref:histidine kinase n=1 Tax=Naegleria gruberi TaxID=5762 RepID=D2VWZ7_NAEGR|nr:uncharacterized protein NAEGRDRAFT_73562 [Naegleria gruberi]EFC38778.1 predicted protein [Naegleria gruberi]|eukprot:XP_002671522.1 predicted protein [Naegleria gruberi strain NEG-M]